MSFINNNFLIADKDSANVITIATVVKSISVAFIYILILIFFIIKMSGYSIKLCEVAPTISINNDGIEELMDLGISEVDANHIIQNRPYKRREELYWNKIITKEEFDAIKWRLSCD